MLVYGFSKFREVCFPKIQWRTVLSLIVLTGLSFGLCAQEAQPLFTFGVVADVQYADRPDSGTRYYRSSPAKLQEAVREFNIQKVDFTVSLGDFINDDFRSYDTLITITAALKAPLHHTLGNHDFSVDEQNKKNVLATLNLDKPYYAFVKNGWRMIILDGADISLFANEQNSRKYKKAEKLFNRLTKRNAVNAYDWNGAVGKEQLRWLEGELSEAARKNEKVLIFCHYPLYPDEAPELLWNAREVANLIEKYHNVFAYFSGHTHTSRFDRKNGVNYVSLRGMVEENANSFAIVSVYEDSIGIKGYGEEAIRSLTD